MTSKISIDSEVLSKFLGRLTKAVPSNPIMPILEDFLVEVTDGKMSVTASDTETTITSSIEVIASNDFAICIPAKLLADTVKALPSQPITIEVDIDSCTAKIKSNNGEYKLASEAAADYPQLAADIDSGSIEIPAGFLLDAIDKTQSAVSNDEIRRAMTGVCFHQNKSGLNLVSTDAHRLVKHTLLPLAGGHSQNIIPAKALSLVANTLKNEDVVMYSTSDSHAVFEIAGTTILTRLIDERYPDYEAVIPPSSDKTATIHREDFLGALRRVTQYANATTNQVKLSFADSAVKIEAENLDYENRAEESFPCSYEGEGIKIGFNGKLLLECVNVLDSENVCVNMTVPSQAAILRNEVQSEEEELIYLLMPVLLD